LIAIGMDTEKNPTDVRNIHVAIVDATSGCWNCSRCYKFGFRIIHISHVLVGCHKNSNYSYHPKYYETMHKCISPLLEILPIQHSK
jgi:hypothetical protein